MQMNYYLRVIQCDMSFHKHLQDDLSFHARAQQNKVSIVIRNCHYTIIEKHDQHFQECSNNKARAFASWQFMCLPKQLLYIIMVTPKTSNLPLTLYSHRFSRPPQRSAQNQLIQHRSSLEHLLLLCQKLSSRNHINMYEQLDQAFCYRKE